MSAEPAPPETSDTPSAVAIARQPIHDRARRVVGYELLFRGTGADTDAATAGHDEERAATSVIVETFTGVGVEAIAGRQPAHVRVSRRFLLELHAFALPPDRVVLELDAPDEDDAALLAVLERLAAERYRVSLACTPDAAPPPSPPHLADSVKVSVTGLAQPQITALAERLRPTGATLIAAGVDTPALLQQCHLAGFDRFQGFFFCTPDVVRAQTPPTAGIAQLRTLAGLYAADTSFEQFEQIIARDVGLSYRLLCYLNSAFFGLRREVASVREALTLLGMRAVRRWATLMALSGAQDKPHELIVTALLRGRMCEAIGRAVPDGASTVGGQDACFTIGLLSVMDALLDAPLAQALEPLPLAEASRAALLERRGPMGAALSAVLAYERGDLAEAQRHVPGVALGALYLSAVAWADAASAGIERSTTDTSASTTSGAN
jgi:EAL and modified HD-GYP domain-containing signal transduction protein